MFVLKLSLVFLWTVCCYGELLPVGIDPSNGRLVAKSTSQEVQILTLKDGTLTANEVDEKNSEVSVTPKFSNDGVAVTISHKKHRVLMKTFRKDGGTVEFPMTADCLMDKECRRDILGAATNVLENGIGYKPVKQIISGN